MIDVIDEVCFLNMNSNSLRMLLSQKLITSEIWLEILGFTPDLLFVSFAFGKNVFKL